MKVFGQLNQWVTNPSLKVPDLSNLRSMPIVRPLPGNSPQASMLQQAVNEAAGNKRDFTKALATTLYTAGKLSTKLPDRKAKVAGSIALIMGKGISSGIKKG